MKLTTASLTNKGVRETNEDFVKCFECNGIHVLVVSDGLGGHGSGDEASKVAVETIEECFRIHPEFSEENVRSIMKAANQNVLNLHEDGKHCKATIVAAFVTKESIMIAHAGDSRCYVFGNKKIRFETRDHSVSQMAVDMGQISKEEIRTSDDRNKVLHCLGSNDFKVDVNIMKVGLFPYKAILLCSDGFWQNVIEKEMLDALHKSKGAEEWIEKMEQFLKEKEDSKQDNYSAAVLWNK